MGLLEKILIQIEAIKKDVDDLEKINMKENEIIKDLIRGFEI